jgi:hypothetical protein
MWPQHSLAPCAVRAVLELDIRVGAAGTTAVAVQMLAARMATDGGRGVGVRDSARARAIGRAGGRCRSAHYSVLPGQL